MNLTVSKKRLICVAAMLVLGIGLVAANLDLFVYYGWLDEPKLNFVLALLFCGCYAQSVRVKMPKIVNIIWMIAAFFILPYVMVGVMESFNGYDAAELPRNLFWLNYFWCQFVYLLLFALSNHYRVSVIVGTLFWYLIGVVNYHLILFRGSPFQLTDVISIGTAADVVSSYVITVNSVMLVNGSIVFFAICLACVADFCKKRRTRKDFVCSILLLAYLFAGVGHFYDEDTWTKNELIVNFWNPLQGYRDNGTALSLAMEGKYLRPEKPAGYSAAAAEKIMLTAIAESKTEEQNNKKDDNDTDKTLDKDTERTSYNVTDRTSGVVSERTAGSAAEKVVDKNTEKVSEKTADKTESVEKDSDKEAEKNAEKETNKDTSKETDKNSENESEKNSNKESAKDTDKNSEKDNKKDSDKKQDKDSDKDSDKNSDKKSDKDDEKDSDKKSDKKSNKESDKKIDNSDKKSNRDTDKNSDKDSEKSNKDTIVKQSDRDSDEDLESYYERYYEEAPELNKKTDMNVAVNAKVKQPNIIAIMNESYADLRVHGEFRTSIPIMTFYDTLSINSIRGNLMVSVLGGGTCNSEFEFLTGLTTAFLPNGVMTYQLYINDELPSMASILRDQGYKTVAFHPGKADSWRRNVVYPYMGFEEFLTEEDMEEPKYMRDVYVTDESDYKELINIFESKEKDEKLFLFNVTIQNHGGYQLDTVGIPKWVSLRGKHSVFNETSQYLSLMRASDNALRDLINHFVDVDEPTMIVFFGDHQPSVENEFIEALKGKSLNELNLKEVQSRYIVPFFIWTNYDIEESYYEMISANYLSTLAMKTAGVELPVYNQYLEQLYKKVPMINSLGYADGDHTYYYHTDKTEITQDIEDYKIVQYNYLFGGAGRLDQYYTVTPEESSKK